MANIALIETKPSRTDYASAFNNEFEFDQYQLCSDPSIKKVLVKDVDIDIDLDAYEWIILVGADAFKYYTKNTSITSYSGKVVDDYFLPVINPSMLRFKPEMKRTWESSRDSIIGYISGTKKNFAIDASITQGITDTKEANEYLKKAIDSQCPYFAIDSETCGLYPRDGYILGISICYDGLTGAYIDTNCFDEETEMLLQRLFSAKTAVLHNAKFDLAFFKYHLNIEAEDFEDTMMLHYLVDENPGTHGLKQLAMDYTDFGDYEKEQYAWINKYCKEHGILKGAFTWDLIPFDIMKQYASIDAIATFQVYEKFVKIKQNKRLKKVYDTLLIPGIELLMDLESNGVPFDMDRLKASQTLMELEIEEAIQKLYTHDEISYFEEIQGNPFNPNSVVQLRKLLFDYLGLNPTGKKTETGQNSTDAEVLEKLSKESEVPALILDIRRKTKIKNTYLDKIIPQLNKDGRLRTNFNLHTTTSGRLSSSGKLNMQQLPRDNPIIKGCIVARPGYKIVAMDLTTAEMYIAAVLSGDQVLMDVFRAGGDFHGAIAHKVFSLTTCGVEDVKELYPMERQAAKAVSFGILYGAGAPTISDTVTKESGKSFSRARAQEVIDDYFSTFKKLGEWIEENKAFISANGFIYSEFGRKRRLPNVMSEDSGVQGHAVRSGLNFLVQSVASDINLLAAIDMNEYVKSINSEALMFALVHDSILAEVPDREVDNYIEKLERFVQQDRGMSIPGCPIGCDFDVSQDYSLGKFEKMYG